MKKQLLLFLSILLSISVTSAQETYIPDANFESYLEANGIGNGTVGDTYVTTANISGVTNLNIANQGIVELTGIQDFTALQWLNASGNLLTSVDLSSNTNLVNLVLSDNQIADLTLPVTTTLTQLNCNYNQLSSIFLENVTQLASLYITNNSLTEIDVSHNTQLTNFQCRNNQLMQLNLSALLSLQTLVCSSNALISLDLSNNLQLNHLNCHTNQLTTLDLSMLTQLVSLHAAYNQFTSIDLRNGVNTTISNNNLTLYYNPQLSCIYVDDKTWSENNWTNIDTASHFIETQTECDYYLQETAIPDSNFEQELINLGYDDTIDGHVLTHRISEIVSLNLVNKNIADLTGIADFITLKNLFLDNNSLTTLDVSGNTHLELLLVANNLLTSIILPNTTSLRQITCTNNHLSNISLNGVTGLKYLYINQNELAQLDLSHNPLLTNLQCYFNQLTQLDVSAQTSLQILMCSNNQLTALDVSNNTSLSTFNCHFNQIETLNLPISNTITDLFCQSNNLSSLDLSDQTNIKKLNCGTNHISELDLSALTQLTQLDVSRNDLTSVDLRNSNNIAITNSNINFYYNPDLTCIYVDDKSWSEANWLRLFSYNHFVETQADCDYYSQETAIPDPNFEQALINLGHDDVIDGHVLTYTISQITNLNVDNKNIADLTGIQDFTALQTLSCSRNQLTSINLSQNTALVELSCSQNQLSNLNITNLTNLTKIACDFNQITSLDLSHQVSLTKITASNNQLTSVDLRNSNNTAITNSNMQLSANPDLSCIYVDDVAWSNSNWTHISPTSHFVADTAGCSYYYQTTSIPDTNFENYLETHDRFGQTVVMGDVESLGNGIANDHLVLTYKIDNLSVLDISNQNIADLTGLQDFISLIMLNCSNNSINSFNFTALTALESIDISHNILTSFDISVLTNLFDVKCNDNQLTYLDVRNGNNQNVLNQDFNATNNPDLTCIYVDDVTWSNNNWTNIDVTSHFVADTAGCNYYHQTTNIPDANFEDYLETHDKTGQIVSLGDYTSLGNGIANDHLVLTHKLLLAENISVPHLQISDLSGIETCTALTDLNCNYNQLTQLDLSNNTALTSVMCADNQLASINLTACAQITHLELENNLLTALDVSTLTALQDLSFQNNQVTTLDISNNTHIENLYASHNLLSSFATSANNVSLFSLTLSDNALTNIDISSMTNLMDLLLQDNQLQDLDASALNASTVMINLTGNSDLNCVLVGDIQAAYDLWLYDWHTHFALNTNDCQFFDTHTYVPDDNFEQALINLGYDDVLDDYVVTANINTVVNLDISNLSISSILGIQDFTALSVFDCSQNGIGIIDLKQNTNLTSVNFSNNILYSLDIRNGNNTQILNFDTTNNASLTCIYVDDKAFSNANWTNIDSQMHFVTNQPECEFLQTHTYVPDDNFEQALINLGYDDVLDNYVVTSNINTVQTLAVASQSIADLTGIEDFSALQGLDCSDNQLTQLDLGNINIFGLDCHDNQIVDLDFSANSYLFVLDCHNNNLQGLNLQNGRNTSLSDQYFDSRNNPSLVCIFVDDATYCTQNLHQLDAQSHFVENQAQCDALSVDENAEQNVNIYPNPVDNLVNIKAKQRIDQIVIFDILGNELKAITPKTKHFTINLSTYPSGVYIVQVKIANQISTSMIEKR